MPCTTRKRLDTQDHEDATMNVDTNLGNNASSSAGPDNLSLAALNNALETLKVGIFSKIDSMAVDLHAEISAILVEIKKDVAALQATATDNS